MALKPLANPGRRVGQQIGGEQHLLPTLVASPDDFAIQAELPETSDQADQHDDPRNEHKEDREEEAEDDEWPKPHPPDWQ